MDPQKRQRFERYFRRLPQWPFAVSAVGLVLLAAGPNDLGKGIGAVALTGAVWAIAVGLLRIPTDAEYDAMVGCDLADLGARALAFCDIGEADCIRDPVAIVSPRFRRMGGAQFGFRRGKDGTSRYTPLNVTIINFTEHQLVIYQCALDLLSGKPLNERGEEFFYSHVVSVSLHSDAYTYELAEIDPKVLKRAPRLAESAVGGRVQVAGAEAFRLVTAGGNSVEVMLSAPSLIEELGGGQIDVTRADKAVQAVRRMLRDKMAGALPLRHPTV